MDKSFLKKKEFKGKRKRCDQNEIIWEKAQVPPQPIAKFAWHNFLIGLNKHYNLEDILKFFFLFLNSQIFFFPFSFAKKHQFPYGKNSW